jgi:hypothetical protein
VFVPGRWYHRDARAEGEGVCSGAMPEDATCSSCQCYLLVVLQSKALRVEVLNHLATSGNKDNLPLYLQIPMIRRVSTSRIGSRESLNGAGTSRTRYKLPEFCKHPESRWPSSRDDGNHTYHLWNTPAISDIRTWIGAEPLVCHLKSLDVNQSSHGSVNTIPHIIAVR